MNIFSKLESFTKKHHKIVLNFINYINQPDKFNDQLMFIVDPILQFIPFEALIDINGKYLIENLEISYTFSTTIHSILKKRDYNAENTNLLAFANRTIKPKNDFSDVYRELGLLQLKTEKKNRVIFSKELS